MALIHYHFFSGVLGKQVGATILLPGTPGPYATYYLLHGLSDDHTIWHRRTRIEHYVANQPLAVVMPDGFRGAYTNNENGPDFADYIIQDVIGNVENHFNLKKSRSARCIGGLSMGGYGALRLGLGFPEMFSSVNSHSGALRWGSGQPRKGSERDPDEFIRVFGKKPAGSDHDLLTLAKKCQDAGKLPKLRIDCGVDDFLIGANRHYHAKLEAMRIAHEYEEFPGAHDWDYWDLHVQQALAFHAKNLKLKK